MVWGCGKKELQEGKIFPDIFLVPHQAPASFLLSSLLCSLVLPNCPAAALSPPGASCLVL